MKKSIVYTRTGDNGTTGLVGGSRISKHHVRLDCYGTIDELNAQIGLLLAEDLPADLHDFLLRLQHLLFNLGGSLATPPEETEMLAMMLPTSEDLEKLERKIDEIDSSLPTLRAFVLPSGGRTAALCHVCRTICRRAERLIYRLKQESPVDEIITQFVNRLSDYFFVLARQEALRTQGYEAVWDPALKNL